MQIAWAKVKEGPHAKYHDRVQHSGLDILYWIEEVFFSLSVGLE